MNWLAHIFVSENSIDYQLGNLLADPLKGRHWPQASTSTVAGFLMHKKIDRFTDTHPIFRRSKSRLGERGYLRSVIVDLVYDHCLSQQWDCFCRLDQDYFIGQFHTRALTASEQYPQRARDIVQGVVHSGYLASYATVDGLHKSFQRIDNRLSSKLRSRESAAAYMPVVLHEMNRLQQDFEQFFPMLLAYFKDHSGNTNHHQWIK